MSGVQGFRRLLSKSLLIPPMGVAAAMQGLPGIMWRSTVAAFPVGLTKSGFAEMLLAS